ncbi:hypothetical protein RhiLY_08209 [Ceratobasidium sp. AG-Ba]|nr:hypothetical protein RhiLY_08209 [Ceratobasidium sp. AG-Ba]
MSTDFKHLSGKIIIHAIVIAQEGQAEKLQSFLKKIQAESTSDKEPGCLVYRINRSGNEFFIFEEYENPAAIEWHFKSAGFQSLVEEVGKGDLVVGAPNITYYQEV